MPDQMNVITSLIAGVIAEAHKEGFYMYCYEDEQVIAYEQAQAYGGYLEDQLMVEIHAFGALRYEQGYDDGLDEGYQSGRADEYRDPE